MVCGTSVAMHVGNSGGRQEARCSRKRGVGAAKWGRSRVTATTTHAADSASSHATLVRRRDAAHERHYERHSVDGRFIASETGCKGVHATAQPRRAGGSDVDQGLLVVTTRCRNGLKSSNQGAGVFIDWSVLSMTSCIPQEGLRSAAVWRVNVS